MAIDFVGSQAVGWAGDPGPTSVTFSLSDGLASAPAVGDFVLVTYSVGAQSDQALTIKNPSGTDYTLVGSELIQASYARSNLRMAYRVMPDPAETSVQFTGADWSFGSAVAVQVFRGVNAADPLDVAAVIAGAAGSRIVNGGSIDPVTPGAVIVVAGGAGTLAGTSGTYTAGELSGFVTANGNDNYDAMVGAGHYAWTSGAFDPAAFGGGGTDSTDDAWTAITIALRPEVTALPPTIDLDPQNQDWIAGRTHTFTASASSNGGTGLSYQWQVNDGGGWANIGTDSASYTTPTLTLAMHGYQYRVTATDSAGSDTSAVATLGVYTLDAAIQAAGGYGGFAFGELAFGEVVLPPAAGATVKVWSGSAFVDGTVKRWNGSAWVNVQAVKRYNGSAWV